LVTFDQDVDAVTSSVGIVVSATKRSAVVTFEPRLLHGGQVDLRVTPHTLVHRVIWMQEQATAKPFTAAMIQRAARINRREKMSTFFYDLDEQTLVQLLREKSDSRQSPEHKMADAIVTLNDHLASRVETRAWSAAYGMHFNRDRQDDQDVLAEAMRVECLLSRLLSPFTPDELIDLFVSFVAGDLHDSDHPDDSGAFGAPDGAQFFHLAEFPLLCHALGIGDWGKLWQPTMRALIVASDVFLHLYWNGGDRKRESYRHRCRDLEPEFRRNLIASHSSRSDLAAVELFGRMLATAYRDSLSKTKRRPFLVRDALQIE
jgi:hypothetical protein